MDSKKPDKDESRAPTPAEKRVDSLTSKKADESKPEPGQASIRMQEKRESEASGKPVLTEKQRIEAREQRRKTRKRRRPGSAATGNALSRGVRATGHEAKRTALFLGRSVLSGIDGLKPVGEALVSGLKRLIAWIAGVAVVVAGLIGRLLAGAGRIVLALDRVVTARRAFTLVALVAGGALIASQFMDYRAIEIGQPGYVAVQDITSAPRTEVKSPIDSHSFILLAAGIVAVAAAALSTVSSRRIIGLALIFAGGLTLAVALAIDLPVGLDVENAELAYAGVKAILLSGFWLELAAGAVLLISGMALTLKSERRPAPARRRAARPTVAGSSA